MTLPVLSTRQAVQPARHPAAPADRPFSEVMEQCNAIAAAGDLVPPCYRGKPGAVLLAKMWADANGVDLFTALQNIYPIQGKPYVAAEMRVDRASAMGYDIEAVESNVLLCRLHVTDPQGRTKSVVAAMPQVDTQGDIVVHPAGDDLKKDNWKNRPSDMLYALACRVADRRLVRSGAALLDAAQDYTDEPDAATALESAVDQALAAIVPIDPEPAEAELVDDEPEPATAEAISDHVSADDLLSAASIKGLSRPRLLKHAQLVLGWSGGTIDDIVADQHVAALLLAAIGADEVQ